MQEEMIMIAFQKVKREDKEKLWNIFQKYYYEMSAYYPIDMDEFGNYQYQYFHSYFEENERIALFIYNDNNLIGFTMINDYSCLGNSIDYAIAEFTIFPQYRKNHYGMETIQKIFTLYPGKWEIKYSLENKLAEAFWIKATQKYKPMISLYENTESVLSFVVIE